MKISQLQKILDSQPSVSGNTFVVSALYVVACALSAVFFVVAAGLFLEGFFHFKIFLNWLSSRLHLSLNEEQRWNMATSFGILSLFLSIIFLGVIYLCRMVLKRNHFMMEIEDWIADNIKEMNGRQKSKKI